MIDAKPFLAYFGHHKCGSKMILNIIQESCNFMGLRHAHFHSPAMWGYYQTSDPLSVAAEKMGLDFVSYISADRKFIGDMDKFRAVHVIRDPRDIVVSSYFSHRYSHSTQYWPELIEFRKVLERLPEDEGLLENIKFTARLPVEGHDLNFFDSLLDWNYSLPNVLEVKFEHLSANPYQVFVEIFEFLGLIDDSELFDSSWKVILRHQIQSRYPKFSSLYKKRHIPAWLLLSFVYTNRFSKLAKGRERGNEEKMSHYRKGISGDWKNYFNEQHKRFFKKNYNDLLVKLGYEQDDRW